MSEKFCYSEKQVDSKCCKPESVLLIFILLQTVNGKTVAVIKVVNSRLLIVDDDVCQCLTHQMGHLNVTC